MRFPGPLLNAVLGLIEQGNQGVAPRAIGNRSEDGAHNSIGSHAHCSAGSAEGLLSPQHRKRQSDRFRQKGEGGEPMVGG